MSATLKIGFWYPFGGKSRTAWQFQLVEKHGKFFLELINYEAQVKQKEKWVTSRRYSKNKRKNGDINPKSVPLFPPIFIMARNELIKHVQFIHNNKEIRPND